MHSSQIYNQLFQLKFTARQLEKQSKKAERESQNKKKKVAECLKKNNTEAARIHANDVIRKHNESINLLRLASKIDGVRAKMETMAMTKQTTAMLSNVTKLMEKGVQGMNLDQVSKVMDQFEQSSQDLEVATSVIEDTMSKADTLAKVDEVDELICQVADQYNLELKTLLPELNTTKVADKQQTPKQREKLNVGLQGVLQ
eukprot:TRINITY_DN12974_c0_g1_i1.p1 TRINITY_DN12974_c0_g1~~TRINITY_DN12974_c0_g1_i1.p1  ORF type:complete len:200 (+),score=43.13 TRINITY_DN12974_c0_g1_i1:50-649(+)